MNSQHHIKMNKYNIAPFLDIIVTEPETNKSYMVYRKPTHTSCYLNAESHYLPTKLQAVTNTLLPDS